jgi:hypothetical protein
VLSSLRPVVLVRLPIWETENGDRNVGRPLRTNAGKAEPAVVLRLLVVTGEEVAVMISPKSVGEYNPESRVLFERSDLGKVQGVSDVACYQCLAPSLLAFRGQDDTSNSSPVRLSLALLLLWQIGRRLRPPHRNLR